MAMKQPDTRVVGFEANNEVAIGGDYCNVALRGNVRKRAFDAIPRPRTFGDDLKDMALLELVDHMCIGQIASTYVKMHWMRIWMRVLVMNLDYLSGLDDMGLDSHSIRGRIHGVGASC
jgi:hypothetical protein